MREEIKQTLGITNLVGMISYLGLLESLDGSKYNFFAFVQERLQDRINAWSAKFLSNVGKEVMIKSVAMALPTYVMSCFRLSKSITTKLSSAVAMEYKWSTKRGALDSMEKNVSTQTSRGNGFLNH